MKSINSKSLATKCVVRTGVIVASLALAGNAFAADKTHVAVNARHTAHPAQTHVMRNYRPALPVPIAQIFRGVFGMPIVGMPIAATVAARAATHAVHAAPATGGYDPTFDSPSPAVDVDNSQSQAAIDAADQAMQQEDQSLQDLDASIAAAAAQNAAAEDMATQDMMNQVNSQ